MEGLYQWFVGIFLTVAGLLIAAFRHLATKMASGDEALRKQIDEVKEKYVRRDDLSAHLSRIDDNMKQLQSDVRNNHQQVLDALRKQ